jgi:hypothetical protein
MLLRRTAATESQEISEAASLPGLYFFASPLRKGWFTFARLAAVDFGAVGNM